MDPHYAFALNIATGRITYEFNVCISYYSPDVNQTRIMSSTWKELREMRVPNVKELST